MLKYYLIFLIPFFSCSSEHEKNNKIIFLSDPIDNEIVAFNDVFKSITEIQFTFGDDDERILPHTFRNILVTTKGKFILPDPYTKQIYIFDSEGNFIKSIGNSGRGPGEFEYIRRIKLDNFDNLWVYDPSQLRLSVFSAPDYYFLKSIKVTQRFSDFIVTEDSKVIVYSTLSDNLISHFNDGGAINQQYFSVKDKLKRIFLGRFQDGGLTYGFDNKSFFVVYPGEFGIRKYSIDGILLSNITTLTIGKNQKFRPITPKFPEKLDPYNYTYEHEEWYNSFLNISQIFVVHPDILLLTLYDNVTSKVKFFTNIYTQDGQVLAEGITLPNEGRIIGTNIDRVFIATDEKMLNDGSVIPATLKAYKVMYEK